MLLLFDVLFIVLLLLFSMDNEAHEMKYKDKNKGNKRKHETQISDENMNKTNTNLNKTNTNLNSTNTNLNNINTNSNNTNSNNTKTYLLEQH